MSRRSLLLVNPHARRGQEAQLQAIQNLQQLGFELVEEPVEDPQSLPDLIRRYRDTVDSVIIASGDGTINAAVEGLLETQLPLGILPAGTANNLARTLGIPATLPEACKVIAGGEIRPIDLGWVNGKYFVNVAGMGLSTEINLRVSKKLKRHWGVFAYAVTALQVGLQSRRFAAEIRWNNQSIELKTFQITVCNGRYYGSGLTVAEDATIEDQRLDLYSVTVKHWWQGLLLIPAIMRGKQQPGVFTLAAEEIEIYTRKPRAIDADGELTTQTPARFRVIPQAIPVFVPPLLKGFEPPMRQEHQEI